MSTFLRVALAAGCFAAVGSVSACDKSGTGASNHQNAQLAALPALPNSVPMEAGPPTRAGSAPPATELPPAPRPVLHRLSHTGTAYAYLDRAAAYDDAVGDSPPDYAFDYGDVNPWAWQADDGSIEYAEPFDGGYRYYYYEPGADTPYLIRDRGYSYAFDGPALVMIYDRAGHALPPASYGSRWDYAGRYLARARALRAAAQADRRPVVAANWAARRSEVAAANARWDAARARNAEWAAYHDRVRDQERAHWQGEREARVQSARQFADYQQHGFRGPPTRLAQNARPAPAAPAPGQMTASGRLRPGAGNRERQQMEAAQGQIQRPAPGPGQVLSGGPATARLAEQQARKEPRQQQAQREEQAQTERQQQRQQQHAAQQQAEQQQAQQRRQAESQQAEVEQARKAERQQQPRSASNANKPSTSNRPRSASSASRPSTSNRPRSASSASRPSTSSRPRSASNANKSSTSNRPRSARPGKTNAKTR